MKTFLNLSILFSVAAFLSITAKAYDEDTHFYGTYSMARFAGIKQEIAQKIALTTQWMDESYISDPTSMILMPITGIKKRRLLHFPSSRIVGDLNAMTQQEVLGLEKENPIQNAVIEMLIKKVGVEFDKNALNFMTETQEEHPFANQILMEGMKAGNLMMASASLHTLEDSFAHAGTPAEQGHACFWHWPDRPFGSVDKYFRMTKAVFKVMAAIRLMLPPDALDCKLSFGQKPNCQLTSTELANLYNQNQLVRSTVSRNVLVENEYIQVAMKDFLTRATQTNYVRMSLPRVTEMTSEAKIQSYMNEIKARGENPDSYLVLELLIRDLTTTNEIDIPLITNNMGLLRQNNVTLPEYISAFSESDNAPDVSSESYKSFVKILAQDLLRWAVPSPLTDSHRMELEGDKSPIRKKEMDMRIAGMQSLIQKLYGEKIEFVKNNTSDEHGFGLEIKNDKQAEPLLPKTEPGVIYATFSLSEKRAFDYTIFKYLFPSLKNDDLDLIVQVRSQIKGLLPVYKNYMKERDQIESGDQNWFYKKFELVKLDWTVGSEVANSLDPKTIENTANKLLPIFKSYLKDTLDTHIVESPDNRFYRNSNLFEKYRQSKMIKPFLTDADVWSFSKLRLN